MLLKIIILFKTTSTRTAIFEKESEEHNIKNKKLLVEERIIMLQKGYYAIC